MGRRYRETKKLERQRERDSEREEKRVKGGGVGGRRQAVRETEGRNSGGESF